MTIVPFILRGQTAEDYFHHGAQFYIFGEKQKAREEVTTGLQHFPNDPKLLGLGLVLKKEEEQKQQQNQQNQNSQKNQDQQEKSEQSKAEQNKEQQNQQAQQQKQEQEKQDQQKQQSEQSQQQKEQQQAQQQTNQSPAQAEDKSEEKEGQAVAAGQMTPEQARQLLDAQKSEEQLLPIKPKEKPVEHARHFKDW